MTSHTDLTDSHDAHLIDEARANDAGAPTLDADTLRLIIMGDIHPLTAWRKAAGLTAKVLAERTGVRPATVSDIEKGKIDPRYSTVQSLARTIGVEAIDIMP
jgi:DNA-binding XRE family transcriptional regulator